MTDFAHDWRTLEEAKSWITASGYRLIATRGPEGMNQGYHLYGGDLVGIRIVADRDQWFTEVRPNPNVSSSEDWFGLEAWAVCLGGRSDVPHRLWRMARDHRELMAARAATGVARDEP